MPTWRASAVMRASARTRLWLSGNSGVAYRLVPVDVEFVGHVRQELGQLHGVPRAATAARLLEGVRAPCVGLKQDTIHQLPY